MSGLFKGGEPFQKRKRFNSETNRKTHKIKAVMKKFFMSLALIAGFSLGASARDEYSTDASILPEAAQTVITDNFKSEVSSIKIERTLGSVSEYEVTLTDGTEISFDRFGDWESVEAERSAAVPSSIVLAPIRDYVAKNYAGAKITGIERDRRGIEVDLSNGIDLHFSHTGKFYRASR